MHRDVRAARTEDLGVLQAIEDLADARFIELFHAEEWLPAPTGAERAAAPGFVLVAVDEQAEVVGFVHVLEEAGVAHLEQLSVLPAHGRRGYGGALVEGALAEAARRGHDRVTLRTYADVPWNAPFYASLGFVITEPETTFHRRLVEIEAALGLDRYGERVQMTARIPRGT